MKINIRNDGNQKLFRCAFLTQIHFSVFKFTHVKMNLSALSPPAIEHTKSKFSFDFMSHDTITTCKGSFYIKKY